MTVALFVGSPRTRSNTRSMATFLRDGLEARGEDVATLDPTSARPDADSFISQSVDVLRDADVLVILAPVYLDAPPHVTLEWLHALWKRRDSLDGASIDVYAVSHSGYFDPVHKLVSLEAYQHFCRKMGWTWRGGLAFGGTSPIDGQPLQEAGPFAKRPRSALERLAQLIGEGRPVPAELTREAGKPPIPLPKRLVVWIMNAVIRKAERKRRRASP